MEVSYLPCGSIDLDSVKITYSEIVRRGWNKPHRRPHALRSVIAKVIDAHQDQQYDLFRQDCNARCRTGSFTQLQPNDD